MNTRKSKHNEPLNNPLSQHKNVTIEEQCLHKKVLFKNVSPRAPSSDGSQAVRRSPRLQGNTPGSSRQPASHEHDLTNDDLDPCSPVCSEMLNLWSVPRFKDDLNKCIPYIVALMLRDGLIDLDKLQSFPLLVMVQWDHQYTGVTNLHRINHHVEWTRFVPKMNCLKVGPSALVLGLCFVRRLCTNLYAISQNRAHRSSNPYYYTFVKHLPYFYKRFVAPFFDSETISSSEPLKYALYITCLLLAHKYTEDKPYDNSSWGNFAGFSLIDLNEMERETLDVIGHELYVGQSEFHSWLKCLHGVLFNKMPPHRILQTPPGSEHEKDKIEFSSINSNRSIYSINTIRRSSR